MAIGNASAFSFFFLNYLELASTPRRNPGGLAAALQSIQGIHPNIWHTSNLLLPVQRDRYVLKHVFPLGIPEFIRSIYRPFRSNGEPLHETWIICSPECLSISRTRTCRVQCLGAVVCGVGQKIKDHGKPWQVVSVPASWIACPHHPPSLPH